MDLPTELTVTRKQLKELTEEYEFLEQTCSQETDQLAKAHSELAEAVAIASAFATALLTRTSPADRPFDEAHRLSSSLESLLPVIDEDQRYEDMNSTRGRLSAALSELSAGRERFEHIFDVPVSQAVSTPTQPPVQEPAADAQAHPLLLEACDELKLALKESTDELFTLDEENQQIRNENFLLRKKIADLEDKCANQIGGLTDDILKEQNIIQELVNVCDAISK